jgi:hypothetical protein
LCEIVDEHPYLSVVGSLEQDELSLFWRTEYIYPKLGKYAGICIRRKILAVTWVEI